MHSEFERRDSICSQSSGREPCLSVTASTLFVSTIDCAYGSDATNAKDHSGTLATEGMNCTRLDDDLPDNTHMTYDKLCAARTKPAKKSGPARQGAKKAKQMERLASAEGMSVPEKAFSRPGRHQLLYQRTMSRLCTTQPQKLQQIGKGWEIPCGKTETALRLQIIHDRDSLCN